MYTEGPQYMPFFPGDRFGVRIEIEEPKGLQAQYSKL